MEVRLDRLLGRAVHDGHGHRVGRLEEFRVRKEGQGWVIWEYVIGAAGLWERLDMGARLLLGHSPRGYVARWDQILFEEGDRIRLTCPLDELRPA